MHLKNRLPFVFFVSLVLTLFLGIFFAHPHMSAAGEIAVVKVDVVNVRTGPGTNNSVFSQVGLAERLPVLGKSGDWCQVRISDGSTGWVAGWLVALETAANTPAPAGGTSGSLKTAVVTGSVVNIRSGPGTGNGIVTQVNLGNTLSVFAQSGDWYCVRLSNGSTGWVAGWLVSLRDAPAEQVSPPVSRGSDGGRVDNQPNKALSLNVSNSSDITSVALKASGLLAYSSSIWNDKLIVDLQGVAPGDLPLSTKVDSKSLGQVRVGYFQKNPDVTRLVFELKGNALYQVSLSADQKTLTVETYIPNISGSYRGRIVTIDPGHGGSDPGAIGAGGTKEKEVNLDIANRVARILQANGAKVVMARSGDSDVDLYERTDKANNAKSDVFVSIHINANNDKSIGGTTTYIYSGTGTRVQESDRLARCIQTEMIKALGLRDVGIRSANFAVLRTSNMPAILVEVAFVSNAAEEKLMRTDSFRSKAAEAIARGIGVYFAQRRTA